MKNSDGSAQCRACHLKIEIKHRGRTALTDHIEKKKHLESLMSFQHVQPVISIFSLKNIMMTLLQVGLPLKILLV